MRTNLRQPLFAIVLFACFAAAAQEPEAPVRVNVEGLPAHVRERILDKAQQGATALIRYLHRTEAVHQLRPQFVIRQSEPAAIAAAPQEPKLARRAAEPAPAVGE
jgi:hypothetical protein